MALDNSTGSVPKEKHRLELSNLEQRTNEAQREKVALEGKQKFPMHVHKPGGLYKQVENEDELAAALGKGWVEDLHSIVNAARETDNVSEMTLEQAAAAIQSASAEELAAIEAKEVAGGARPKVIALINEAKDNIQPVKKGRK
jgi:hypothetical protein